MLAACGDNPDRHIELPLLSVVVATRNRPETVRASLSRIRALAGIAIEVIVVDDASDGVDPGQLVAAGLADFVIRMPRNVGVDAFNAGVACARGRYLLVLDDDAWPDDSSVGRALVVLEGDRHLGAVSLHPRHPKTRRSEWPFVAQVSEPMSAWPLIGPGSVVRAEAWHAVGGYEAAFFLYSNDTDFALKLLGSGWGVYMDPALVVWHDCPTAVRRPRRWFRLAVRNRIWTVRRHARGIFALKYAVAAWLEAHHRAGFDARRQTHALFGALCGFLGRTPRLPDGVGRSGEGMASIFALRRGRVPAKSSGTAGGRSVLGDVVEEDEVRHVTAVVPSFGRHADIEALLRDLSRLRRGSETFDVIVVDNASDPPLGQVSIPRGLAVEFLRLRANQGGSGGFNAGIERAMQRSNPPTAVWLLDSDVRVCRGALASLLEAVRGRSGLCAAGSAMHDPLERDAYEIGGWVDRRTGRYRPAARGRQSRRTLIDAEYLAATSLLVRTSAIRRVGVLPEAFLNGDDVEWTIRLAAGTGMRLVGVPRSRILHPMGQSPTLARYYQSRNALRPADAAGLPRMARIVRVILEAGRAFAMGTIAQYGLAALHVRGLRDAFRGLPPASPETFELRMASGMQAGVAALARAVQGHGEHSVVLHPRLRLTPSAREDLAAALGAEELAELAGRIRKARVVPPSPLAVRHLWLGLARLLLGPTAPVAIAPIDEHPSVWGCARTVLLVWPGGAELVNGGWRRRSVKAGALAAMCLTYGIGAALRRRPLEPLPQVSPTRRTP